MRARDPERQANCYAPVVDQFFGRRNVSVADVRRTKARSFAGLGPREFSISDVRLERLNPDSAVVSLVKTWDSPSEHFSASSREEMVVRLIDGSWKIASERELSAPPGSSSNEGSRLKPGSDDSGWRGAGDAGRADAITGNH
jgi:hypothetical protein